jgi:ABC-type transport system involved in cytochrome c biogenesis permease subunit
MSEAIKAINVPAAPRLDLKRPGFLSYLPALLPLLGAALMVTARIQFGPTQFLEDGALIVIALFCYIIAAAMHLTNLYAPLSNLQKLGLWTASLGCFFNLSSWLIRWVAAGDRENWVRLIDHDGVRHAWWFFSYIPFANLYDLSVAFAFGAAFATLLIEHRPGARFVGALSMPLIALVLLLATFIGSEFINLPPILDSYWRPIHVGVASISYGVALVSFALAVMFLLKDGVKIEAMGIWVMLVTLGGYVFLSAFFHLAFAVTSLTFRMHPALPLDSGRVMAVSGARVVIPGVGAWLSVTLLLFIVTMVCFLLYLYKNNERARSWGHRLLKLSLISQAASIGWLFYQIKNLRGVGTLVGSEQWHDIGKGLVSANEAARMNAQEFVQIGANFMERNRAALTLDVRTNPVEVAALITIFVATLLVILFSFRTERLREGLPPLEKLDGLIYKAVGVAFAGLAILLVTGAVWANESWGRYWAWDPKETGALVAWLAYAGYLHTRIAHGWSGRRSAYFALLGFLLVIFTYLGVSYILPGIHSYA